MTSLVAQEMQVDPTGYDRIIVAFSGGKDSLACLLHLLELGVPPEKIELRHYRIDPVGEPFMDWPCTPAYCASVARALGVPMLNAWKERGFLGEVMRDDEPTAPTSFETPSGEIVTVGGKGPKGTRLKFPQVAASLSARWCSAYLKIDVGDKVFCNDPRFAEGTFLVVTGERGEESPNRARYAQIQEDRAASKRRRIFQWRPVLRWTEREVWSIIERWKILPHPGYRLGWGRLSCMTCIFGSPDQWAAVLQIAPAQFERIAALEVQFGRTIRRSDSVRAAAAKGTSFVPPGMEWLVRIALSEDYTEEVVVTDWQLPAGAFRKDGGPS